MFLTALIFAAATIVYRVLILTGSPSSFNAEETLSTMRFGRRAKTIKNKPHINVDLSVKEYKAILKKLQAKSERQGKLIVALKGDITKSQVCGKKLKTPTLPLARHFLSEH